MPEPAGLGNRLICRIARPSLEAKAGSTENAMQGARADDVAIRVWFRLIRLESRLGAAVSERLREIGLSVPQCDVLTTLTEEEGVSQQALAKRLYVTKGNISGLLDRLEWAALVARRSTANDRRQYEIHLTAAGREAALRAIAIQHDLIRKTFGRVPEADLESFETMLVTLRDIVRAEDAEELAK
jgi:DNA-binding MarR family transcriptional regulator